MGKGTWVTIGVIVVVLVLGIFLIIKGGQNYQGTVNDNLNYTGLGNSNAQQQNNSGELGTTTETSTETKVKTYDVRIYNADFILQNLTIHVGDTVRWTNEDTMGHTITSDVGGELISSKLYKGGVFEHTFNTAGRYDYHCSIHTSMRGTVIVN